MGNYKNINYDKFPKQGKLLDKRVKVCFHYDSSKEIKGTIIRDDIEEPFRTIIALDNKKIILASECQFILD